MPSSYASTEGPPSKFCSSTRDFKVTEGANSVLCYGVINAKSVRMEPPVEGVRPSLNKCVEVAPSKETRYTLVAEGNDGQMISESFVLGVQADVETLPKITSFDVMSQSLDYLGHPVYLVGFNVQNPEEVSIEPPAFPDPAPRSVWAFLCSAAENNHIHPDG